jgi:hypothetical protein
MKYRMRNGNPLPDRPWKGCAKMGKPKDIRQAVEDELIFVRDHLYITG